MGFFRDIFRKKAKDIERFKNSNGKRIHVAREKLLKGIDRRSASK